MKKDQAERYNQGKPKLSMVLEMPHAVEGVARVLEHGAEVYSRRNYQLGLPWTEVLDSLLRHASAWVNGEDLAPESGLPHADHMACNAMFLAEFARTRAEFDDRCGGGAQTGCDMSDIRPLSEAQAEPAAPAVALEPQEAWRHVLHKGDELAPGVRVGSALPAEPDTLDWVQQRRALRKEAP